jgi:hypothetical protein
MALTASGHYLADERFPPGTKVTVDDFAPGDYHVCHDWPENVPAYVARTVHIAGYDSDGVLGEAWIDPDRLHRA